MKGKVKPLIAFLTTSKPQQQLSLSISIRRDNRIMCEHYKTLSLVLSRRKFHKIVYGHFFHMSLPHKRMGIYRKEDGDKRPLNIMIHISMRSRCLIKIVISRCP